MLPAPARHLVPSSPETKTLRDPVNLDTLAMFAAFVGHERFRPC